MCTTESDSTKARYNHPRFVKALCCGVANNHFDVADELADDDRVSLGQDEFHKLLRNAFGYEKTAHMMAALKRRMALVPGSGAFVSACLANKRTRRFFGSRLAASSKIGWPIHGLCRMMTSSCGA